MENRHVLARSKNYEVSHEFEVVFLSRCTSSNSDVIIGDFYGDPTAALIDEKERFAIVVGCGIIIYNLTEPFESYQYNVQSNQWKELFREPNTDWWLESIKQIDENTFHFTVDPNSNKSGSYQISLPELAIQKLW